MRRPVVAFASLFALTGSCLAADLQSAAPEELGPEQRDFVLQITPYLWAANLDGRVSPFRRAPTIGIEQSFSDTWDDLNFGGFVNVWGRAGRIVFSGDVMYVDTTQDRSFSTPPLPIPIPPGTHVGVEIDSTQFTATAEVGYRVLDAGSATLDVLGGARYWNISTDVSLRALGNSRSYREDFDWVDPIIGARGFIGFTDRLSVQAQADIGGVGTGSDFTWSVLATANYAFTNHLSFSGGYKVLDVVYEHDGHVFDTTLQGPVVGLTYRF